MPTSGNDLKLENKQLSKDIVAEAKAHGAILGGFAALLWVIQIINAMGGGWLTALGVHPRSIAGLWGILFAPFIHVNFPHIIANTIPLLVLGWFVMLRKKRDLFTVSAFSAIVGGLGIWLIAPSNSVHVGASILIFGYLGYLLFRGIFERRFWPIVGSIVTFVLYGGALFGILPGQEGISWQGHLFGLIGGIIAARVLRDRKEDAPAPALKRTPALAPRARVDIAPPPAPAPIAADIDIDDELEALRARTRQ